MPSGEVRIVRPSVERASFPAFGRQPVIDSGNRGVREIAFELQAHEGPSGLGVEAEPLPEVDAVLDREALRLGFVTNAAEVRGLVGEDRDRERRVVARPQPSLDGDPVEGHADTGREIRESAWNERDSRSV